MRKYLLFTFLAMFILSTVSGCGKNALLSALPGASHDSGGGTVVVPSVIFSENFNAFAAGQLSNGTFGWAVNSGSFSTVTIDNAIFASASRSLRLELADSTKGGVQITHAFNWATALNIEFNCQSPVVTGLGFSAGPTVDGVFPVYAQIRDGNIYIFYLIFADASFKSWAGVDTQFAVSANTWYKLNLRVDISSKTWSVLINGSAPPANSNGTFNLDGGLLDGVKFQGKNNSVCYFDDIKVTR